MAKDKYPPEFPSMWHYEAHLDALARELAGREARIVQLKDMKAHPEELAAAEAELAAVRAELVRYGKKKASRPRKAAESRGK